MSDKLFDYGIECIRTRHKGVDIGEARVAIRHVINIAQKRLGELTDLEENQGPTPRRVLQQRIEISETEKKHRAERRRQIISAYRSEIMYGTRNIDDLWWHELAGVANHNTFLGLLAKKLMQHGKPNEKVQVRDLVSKTALQNYIWAARKEANELVKV